MFRSKLVLASLIAVFLACSQVQAVQTTSHWNVSGEGLWGTAGNWDPTGVPNNNTFDVVIDPEGDLQYYGEVEVGLQNNYTINKLDCDGRVDLESWGGWCELTLDHEDGLRNFGYLEIEWIDIIGKVTNWGMLELCDMEIEGNLYNLSGATIGVEYEAWVEDDLENGGTIEIYPMSQLGVEGGFGNNGTILIYGGECGADRETLYNYGVIRGFGVLYGGQDVQNHIQGQGQIIASGGSLVVACEGTLINTSTGLLRNEPLASLQIKPHLHSESPAYVNNYGIIEVNAGGGVALDWECYLVNESGGTIELRGGTLAATGIDQMAGADFAGFGTITSQMGLSIETDAEIELTGPTNIIGNLYIDSGATLVISAGQTLITGQTTNDGTIVLAGGTVIFQGGYSGSGKVIDGAHPGGIIIDNDDDGTSSTGSWKVSGVSGYYGENSLYNSTNGNSYSFEAWVLGAREVSLWWTAHSGRSAAVPVKIYDGGDLLDTVIVNQKNNGGKWNALGYYSFTDKAEVKIVSPGGGATVADAVKFGPSNEIIMDNGDEGTSSTGSWKVSNLSGYYGENSLYNSKSGDSYSFEAFPILGTYKISLWWTAHANRSTNVSVEYYDGGTCIGAFIVNQRENGGKWNTLGEPYTFTYKATVKITCPGDGNNAVADAVKFAPL